MSQLLKLVIDNDYPYYWYYSYYAQKNHHAIYRIHGRAPTITKSLFLNQYFYPNDHKKILFNII